MEQEKSNNQEPTDRAGEPESATAPGSALEFLREKEWSMGNGQCPECEGCPEDWFGHPCHMRPETIGHRPDCKLAAAIESVGGTVLRVGDFQPGYHFEYTDGPNFMSKVRVYSPNAKRR